MYSQINAIDSDDMEMMDNGENGNEPTEEEEPKQGKTLDQSSLDTYLVVFNRSLFIYYLRNRLF